MKVLSIGNSFSQDAHRYLHAIAQADGFTLDTVNLFIGGCSLERHRQNAVSGAAEYSMEGNDGQFIKNVSLPEALESEPFDVVTLQQVSGLSGRPQSYFPFLTDLAAYVRERQPDATLYFHRTWSYETGSDHPDFAHYNRDRGEMYRRLCDATEMAAKVLDVSIIPAGDLIEVLSTKTAEFDPQKGGVSLYRDGFHLSLTYGRFAAAAVWYQTLTGRKPNAGGIQKMMNEWDPALIETIIKFCTEEKSR